DSTGGWAAIKRTAAAAWRAKARDLGLNKDDVKIEDLRYLTKSMLESVAMSDKSLKGELPAETIGQAMFAGPAAKTASLGYMQESMKRLDAGEDPELVRRETGWERGQDGKMRFEFADNE